MTIDLNKTRVQASFMRRIYHRDTVKDANKRVSEIAGAVQTPCIALAFYLAEDIGYTPELTFLIDTLIKFYRYDQILGQKEDSPYLHLMSLVK